MAKGNSKVVAPKAGATEGLTKTQSEDITKLGIKFKTADQAKAGLIKYLAGFEVDSVEDEGIHDLILMAQQFAEEPTGNEEEEEELDEAIEEDEELAEEDEEEMPEEEDDEPVAKPAKTAKPAAKAVAAKAAPKAAKAEKQKNTEKFQPIENKKHLKLAIIETLLAFFPKDVYEIDILTRGFTVRLLGDNTKPTIMCFDHLRILADQGVVGDLFCNRFDSEEDLETSVPGIAGDHETGKYTNPFIRVITGEEVAHILKKTAFLKIAKERALSSDKKMGSNRAKLEEKLKTDNKAKKTAEATKPVAKPAAVPAKPVAKKK